MPLSARFFDKLGILEQGGIMWNEVELALLREAGIAGNSVSAGLTALRAANHATPGLYAHAFFSLSIGLERFMKIIVILDHLLTSGKGPTERDMRALGHDLEQLFAKMADVASRHGLETGPSLIAPGTIEIAALQFLSRFAQTTRYYNIDLVAKSPRAAFNIDPIKDWYDNVGGMILAKHLSAKKKLQIEALARQREIDFGNVMHVAHTAEDGSSISTVYQAVFHANESEVVRKYGTLYVARICRSLYYMLFDAVHKCLRSGINVPVLYELFFPFINKDSLFLSRKTFAPQSQ